MLDSALVVWVLSRVEERITKKVVFFAKRSRYYGSTTFANQKEELGCRL